MYIFSGQDDIEMVLASVSEGHKKHKDKVSIKDTLKLMQAMCANSCKQLQVNYFELYVC